VDVVGGEELVEVTLCLARILFTAPSNLVKVLRDDITFNNDLSADDDDDDPLKLVRLNVLRM